MGFVGCALAGLLPIGVLGDLVSMGTLLAFATVCAGMLALRRTRTTCRTRWILGGTQNIRLPHTQVASARGRLLQPDVLVVGNSFRPMSALESILRLERAQ